MRFFGPFRGFIHAGGDEDDEEIRVFRARNEVFRAVDNPITAVTHGLAFHAAHVRSGIRFRHRQRVHFLTTHGGQQITFALFVVAGHQDVLRTAKEMGQRHRAAAQLALDQSEVEMRQTGPTDLFGEIAGVETQIDALLLDLLPSSCGT